MKGELFMNLNERRQELVTEGVAKAMCEVLTKLLSILRWSSYIGDYRYNELNKQALNAAITYFLAIEAWEKGKQIDITRFPKIIFHRTFEKLFLCDIREDYIEAILKNGNIKRVFNSSPPLLTLSCSNVSYQIH